VDVGLGVELLDVKGILDGRLAADSRTIGPLGRTGAHALDHDNPFGLEGPIPELLLQFYLGNDILPVVPIEAFGSEGHGPGGNHDAAYGLFLLGAGLVANRYLIIADDATYGGDLALEQNRYVWLCLNLLHQLAHQLGRLIAAGANPVDAPEQPAEFRRLFHKDHFRSHVGQSDGCRQTGNTRANHHGFAHQGRFDVILRLKILGFSNRHPDQVARLEVGIGFLLHVHPGTLIANVCHFEQVRIQARLGAGGPEQGLVCPGSAGRHHHPVQVPLPDGGLDLVDAALGTGIQVFLHVHDVGQGLGVERQGFHIQVARDVAAAIANEHSNTDFLSQFSTS